jgi:predicted YcjX-like family ATPase
MIAAAWGVDRILDALEATPGAKIDPLRVGVTGCSRNGKGAMVAGAFVDRIAPSIP